MFAKILAVLVVLIGIFAGVAYIQPDQYDVSRSAVINAPASAVYEQVNNLRKWESWSPWAKLDPNQKVTFSGPEAGKDAKMSWIGDSWKVGEGSMVITETQPNERVAFNLDFVKPMKGTSTAEFTFKPQGNATEVTWSSKGQKDFLQKAMGLVFNCEKMMGEYFDKGLASMKEVVEGKAPPSAAAVPVPEAPAEPTSPVAPASEVQPAPEAAPPALAPEAVPESAAPLAPEAQPAPEAAPAPAAPETAPQQP